MVGSRGWLWRIGRGKVRCSPTGYRDLRDRRTSKATSRWIFTDYLKGLSPVFPLNFFFFLSRSSLAFAKIVIPIKEKFIAIGLFKEHSRYFLVVIQCIFTREEKIWKKIYKIERAAQPTDYDQSKRTMDFWIEPFSSYCFSRQFRERDWISFIHISTKINTVLVKSFKLSQRVSSSPNVSKKKIDTFFRPRLPKNVTQKEKYTNKKHLENWKAINSLLIIKKE